MDQIKIGAFLKQLRKEQELTQEALAERLGVSNRTVSRWETGSNMPDIGMLIEIAELYGVGIPEIINAERKSELMNQETKETAAAMAEYSRNEVKTGKRKVIGGLLAAFGVFLIMSALAIFPSESSWGSIYSYLGSIILLTGLSVLLRTALPRRGLRALIVALCAALLFGTFSLTDYLAVTKFHQVPRFCYEVSYDSRDPDQLVYKTLFFTAVRSDPGTEQERVEIVKK